MITRLKTPTYKLLMQKYCLIYNTVREAGYNGEQAFLVSKIKFQELIIDFMFECPADASQIIKAYESIKSDQTLREKIMINYDMKNCSESVRKKYAQLVGV